jgi:hypothetical protein
MKGRAFEPSHPVSITICPIPHVHSNADQHTKHEKQQRREEVTMFFLESFEVPTQNLYTSIWYSFYVNDRSSTQHTPYHQYKILESPIDSQFFISSQFLIRIKSIPVKQDPLSLKGHQQSPSPAVSIYHEQQQQIGTRSFLIEVNNSHIQVQLQFKLSPKSGTPPEQTRYFCQYWFHPHKLKCAFIKKIDSFESQISSSEFSFSRVAVISREQNRIQDNKYRIRKSKPLIPVCLLQPALEWRKKIQSEKRLFPHYSHPPYPLLIQRQEDSNNKQQIPPPLPRELSDKPLSGKHSI